MTTTITCTYSDFQFEADSRRVKRHPMVADFLDGTVKDEMRYRRQAWGSACDILAAQRGLHSTIEDYMATVQAEFAQWLSQVKQTEDMERQIERERSQAKERRKRLRQEINRILRENGFRWVKEGFVDEEDADHFAGFATVQIGTYWTLWDAEQNKVTIQQAFDRIGQPIPEE